MRVADVLALTVVTVPPTDPYIAVPTLYKATWYQVSTATVPIVTALATSLVVPLLLMETWILVEFLTKYEEKYKTSFVINNLILDNEENLIEKEVFQSSKSCPTCGLFNNIIKTIQIRAGDEIEDIFLTCFNRSCPSFLQEINITKIF